jgi:hypothetical protein
MKRNTDPNTFVHLVRAGDTPASVAALAKDKTFRSVTAEQVLQAAKGATVKVQTGDTKAQTQLVLEPGKTIKIKLDS